ncbi:MAG: phosphatidylglycerol lysyltransferase domain-containing protein [Treponema sp.]|nr:phosphatidylglycerol lysyltransferase domain-containing protein [Treponema sp.]MCL2252345.1 phosphatidylglycerol lysyltransferase domain-containing protein [Treponema sp.]
MKTEINIIDALKPASFSDFDIIYNFLKKHPVENCDYNICNLFSWDLFLKLEYMFYSDRLILFNPFYKYFLSPVGEPLCAEELYQLYNSFKNKLIDIEILGVSEDYINNNPDLKDYFIINNDENLYNYIYSTENLVKLPGKKLAKKKNLISQFIRLYPDFKLKPVSENDYNEIVDFCNYWKKTQEAESENLNIEFEAIKSILTHWNIFPCKGLKLYSNGNLCAFSIYSSQTEEMAAVHFEKYDSKIKGAGQVINQETAKLLLQNFKYVNREQDMGSAGLRQAKRSYQPVRMLAYYRLKGKI